MGRTRMSNRKIRKPDVVSESVNVKWGEQGAKMCNNKAADIIFVDMEEEEDDDIGDTVTSFIKTLDKNRTEKKNLKDFMKLSLSQEVDKVSNLFKIQTQVKESKIKSVLDELKVYLAEMDIWQNQLQHKSQKNVELSKELEEKFQEKHENVLRQQCPM